jgi:hypothetical protein
MELYREDRINIEDWRRNRGLKMIKYLLIQIYYRKGFIREGNSLKGDSSVKKRGYIIKVYQNEVTIRFD